MRHLYTLCLYLALPFILLRLLWRSRYIPGYRRRWTERFGYIANCAPKQSIWLHAVSVGETIAAAPLVKALLKEYPDHAVIVTSMTPTGSEQVSKQFGNSVQHAYVPYDTPRSVMRFLEKANPSLSIIMETELWPNLLHFTRAKNIPILLANARLSNRSYQGYRKIKSLTETMLSHLTMVAAQSKADGQRFVELGLDRQKLKTTGNIKFDLQLPASLIEQGEALRRQWEQRSILIAASTHEGEESIILEAFAKIRRTHPQLLLLLVPRHPDRFNKVAQLCEAKGYKTLRRSTHQAPDADTDILLGDTMGELRLLYATSDIAFVGGSLVPVGGHNLIEPAALRLPILSGPILHNFVEISDMLKAADALIITENADILAENVSKLLSDRSTAHSMGERAYEVSANNTGALDRHLALINTILSKA